MLRQRQHFLSFFFFWLARVLDPQSSGAHSCLAQEEKIYIYNIYAGHKFVNRTARSVCLRSVHGIWYKVYKTSATIKVHHFFLLLLLLNALFSIITPQCWSSRSLRKTDSEQTKLLTDRPDQKSHGLGRQRESCKTMAYYDAIMILL